MSTTRAWLGVGSNLNQPIHQVQTALNELANNTQISIIHKSSLYQTKPWGGVAQADFINAVVLVETALSAPDLLAALKVIEQAHERKPTVRWGARSLDLDILLFGDALWDTDALRIPHPHMHERGFVLVPMAEIDPDYRLPHIGKSVQELASEFSDGIVKLNQCKR